MSSEDALSPAGRGQTVPGGYAEQHMRNVQRELSFDPAPAQAPTPGGGTTPTRVPYAVHDGTDARYAPRPYTASPNMFRGANAVTSPGPGVSGDFPPSMRVPPPRNMFAPRSPFPYGAQKPMRGLQRIPANDAAGLLQRWQGKELPERRHTQMFDHTGEIQPGTGRRKNAHSHLLKTVHDRDILGFHGFSGVEDADGSYTFSKRVKPEDPHTKGYKMSGAAIEYLAPEEGERKVRGPGQPGKSYKVQTGARTMMQGGHMKPQEVDPDVNLRKHVRPVEDKPKDRMREIVRDYKYGTPVMGELYGGFDKTRDFERQHYETRVIGKPSTTTAAHSSYYYQLYRARAHAPSSIFSDPLYEKRPQTAPAAGY